MNEDFLDWFVMPSRLSAKPQRYCDCSLPLALTLSLAFSSHINELFQVTIVLGSFVSDNIAWLLLLCFCGEGCRQKRWVNFACLDGIGWSDSGLWLWAWVGGCWLVRWLLYLLDSYLLGLVDLRRWNAKETGGILESLRVRFCMKRCSYCSCCSCFCCCCCLSG